MQPCLAQQALILFGQVPGAGVFLLGYRLVEALQTNEAECCAQMSLRSPDAVGTHRPAAQFANEHPKDIERGFWPKILRLTEALLDHGFVPVTPSSLITSHAEVAV